MPIRFSCPVCGYRIKAPEGSYGRRGQCPRCKLMIRLPTEAELAERPAERSSEQIPDGHVRPATPAPGPCDSGVVPMSGDSSVEFELGSPGQ